MNQAHESHAFRADTTAYTAFNMSHCANIVNQPHKRHATRADTTAYTEHMTEAEGGKEVEKHLDGAGSYHQHPHYQEISRTPSTLRIL